MTSWDKATQDTFRQVLAKMPVFMRPIAEKAITLKAESLAKKDNRAEVTEKYLVDALFIETPFGFQGLMKNDLASLGVDYTKYGHAK
ncbi:MAG: hypothetical protein V1840_05165 [Candidatus Omnitrophota bacterium]